MDNINFQENKTSKCRFCGEPLRFTLIDLGMSPLCESYLSAEHLNRMEPFYPLHVFVCENCYLAQLEEYVSPEHIFTEYAYFSSYAVSWLQHAQNYTRLMVERFNLNQDSFVVEVASNDGYLLQFYKARGIPVLGIEPAANIAELAIKTKGIPTLVEFFDEDLAQRLAARGQFADIIHAHNVFAHVPDPNEFAGGVKKLLKPDGMAVIEAPYVRDLITKLEFDTIYHEHFSYYSLSSVEALCRRHGLMIHDVELVPIHGGSLRLFIAHAGGPASLCVGELLAKERSEGLLTFDYYRDFANRVARLKQQLLELLQRLKKQGRRIAAYGASAKGSTLMNAFGIDGRLIDFVVDRSHLKQGRFTPGNHLPILPPQALLERRPDYVLLLTWNFAAEILAQQDEFRRCGGKFIVPVPEVAVL